MAQSSGLDEKWINVHKRVPVIATATAKVRAAVNGRGHGILDSILEVPRDSALRVRTVDHAPAPACRRLTR